MASSQALAVLREAVDGFLRKSFEEVRVDRVGDFHVRPRGVTTWIQVRSLDEDQTAVLIWSPSNIGMAVNAELTGFLATEGNNLAFGQFELHDVGPRIHVSHALLGEFLSREELAVAVESVAEGSAHYGPIVKERFGGRLASELEIRAGEPIPLLEEIAEVVDRTGRWPPEPATAPESTRSVPPRRAAAVQGVLSLVGVAAGIVASVYAYRETSSWFLVAFVFLAATYLISRGLSDVLTDPLKVGRTVYFVLPPAVATGVLFLAHEWWGRWWLAVLLAVVGWIVGAWIANVLFPRIAAEELRDTAERARRGLGLGR